MDAGPGFGMSPRTGGKQWFTWAFSVALIGAGVIGLSAAFFPEPIARLKTWAGSVVSSRMFASRAEADGNPRVSEPSSTTAAVNKPGDRDGRADVAGRELSDDENSSEKAAESGPVRFHGLVSETDGDEPFVSGSSGKRASAGDGDLPDKRGLDPASAARSRRELLDDNDFSRTADITLADEPESTLGNEREAEPGLRSTARSSRSVESSSRSNAQSRSRPNTRRDAVELSANAPKSVNGLGGRRRDSQLRREIRSGLDDADEGAGVEPGSSGGAVRTVGFDDEAPSGKPAKTPAVKSTGARTAVEKRDPQGKKRSRAGDDFGLEDPADDVNRSKASRSQRGTRVGANRDAELDNATADDDGSDPESVDGTGDGTIDEQDDFSADTVDGADAGATDRTPLKLLLKGNRGKARTIAASGKPAPTLSVAEIEKLTDEGELYEAQRQYSLRYWQFPEERPELGKQLETIGQELFFSPQPHFEEPYVVKPGDQLRVLAQRYNLSWDYLAKLNHTEPRKLRAGQRLKVVNGPFSAIVSISDFELIVHLQGVYVRSYKVGVGKAGSTPIGEFVVKNKLKNPTYYGPDGVIAADAENNPLGERWIDIGDSYGIHGTVEPDTIGKSESRGCIRMLAEDVEEVYDLLTIGSVVKIQK